MLTYEKFNIIFISIQNIVRKRQSNEIKVSVWAWACVNDLIDLNCNKITKFPHHNKTKKITKQATKYKHIV